MSLPTLRLTNPYTTGPAVRQLQELLNRHNVTPRLNPDSTFGPNTDRAVRDFQRRRGLVVDGVVGPRTWAALGASGGSGSIGTGGTLPGTNPPAGNSPGINPPGGNTNANTSHDPEDVNTWWYPFSRASNWSHKTGPRQFGSSRSGGRRKHAGCDLYFPAGTWIHAVADGTVLYDAAYFYMRTYELAIRHGRRVVRYGEIAPNSWQVRGGQSVRRGQRIAKVGVLTYDDGRTLKGAGDIEENMLHFELYSGSASGGLTQRGNAPYQRRSDLQNPTQLIDLMLGKYPQD